LAVAAVVLLFCVAIFLHTIFRIATGKMTDSEKERILAECKRDKERKNQKRFGFGHTNWLSYPSPLNSWGLWH